MTKAQERTAQIEANKRIAYGDKVRRLTGQLVSSRLAQTEVLAAYCNGQTAEAFAAEVASREPVGKAVWPLKAKAIEAAAQKAHGTIQRVRTELDAAGWDIKAAAPYPRDLYGHAAQSAKARYSLFHTLTTEDTAATRAWHDAAPEDGEDRRAYFRAGRTERVVMYQDGMDRFVAQAEQQAAFEYDAFVCKLVAKVGDVESATLTGDHVWYYSVLTVDKRLGDGKLLREAWKTQQIWNVSVLGNHFPQWPTRLMK